jgi:hypothetical protein
MAYGHVIIADEGLKNLPYFQQSGHLSREGDLQLIIFTMPNLL